MPAETAQYIHQLNADKPTGGESISEGDDHLRVIKGAVKETFKRVTGPVTSTHTELNDVGKTASDLAALTETVSKIDTNSHGNVASCYFSGGSRLYEYNVSDVTKTPGNDFGTRIIFRKPLQGTTPNHYSFSITPVSIGGLPICINVSNVQKDFIDFVALQFQNGGGDWVYMEGTTADFSLIVIDMEAGQ